MPLPQPPRHAGARPRGRSDRRIRWSFPVRPLNVASEPEHLTKGQPTLTGEATINDRTPQSQHINPGIGAPRRGIARHGKRCLDRCRPPWLHPWDTTGLQFGNDLVSDFDVGARPVVADASSSGLDIAVLRDGCRKPLSRSSTRHGQTQALLSLLSCLEQSAATQGMLRRSLSSWA